jgi:thymidylate synthase
MLKHVFSLDSSFEREFISAISNFEKKEVGPFLTEKYFLLIPELKMAMSQLFKDCEETRRCIINFPPEHCFQSIQFLLRGNTVHVVCYMRSCNAIKNLPYDMWLCSKLADMYVNLYEKISPFNERPYSYHSITMMFGSLHVFKEDVKDVF